MTRLSFSLDDKVVEDFRKICKDNYLNQSAIIVSKLKEVIEEYSKEVKK